MRSEFIPDSPEVKTIADANSWLASLLREGGFNLRKVTKIERRTNNQVVPAKTGWLITYDDGMP